MLKNKDSSQLMVSLFANFRIDNHERMLRLRDSLRSISQIYFLDYSINIRGSFKTEARRFLETELSGRRLLVTEDDDPRGWAHQSLKLSSNISGNLVFIWVEDHIFQSTPAIFSETIKEAFAYGADFLYYSFLTPAVTNQYRSIQPSSEGCYTDIFTVSSDSVAHLAKRDVATIFTSTMVSIVTKDRFLERLKSIHTEFLKWPHETPFNFEQVWGSESRTSVHVALPKNELFVSIDDDLDPNYCLISRGLYPNRVLRNQLRVQEGLTGAFRLFVRDFLRKITPILSIKLNGIIKAVRYTIRYKYIEFKVK